MSARNSRRFVAAFVGAISLGAMMACAQDEADETAKVPVVQNSGADESRPVPEGVQGSDLSTTSSECSTAAAAIAIDPGFDVVKTAFSPDSEMVVLVGNGVVAILSLSGAELAPEQPTEVERPSWAQYSPDGSEIWIGDRSGTMQRLHPRTGAPITSDVVWETRAGDVDIVSPTFGEFTLTQNGRSADVAGRIVARSDGELQFDGAIYFARRPDALLRFLEGSIDGETDQSVRPVGAMAVACNDRCLLTAENAQAAETFVWSLSTYAPTPARIAGQVFLDAGEAALDATGQYALLLSAQGLRRIAMPPAASMDGQPLRASVSGARLSADARHAFVLDDNRGWRVYEASDMSPVPEPDWLDSEQHMAAVAPDGSRAVFADRTGGLRLTDTAYQPLREFDVDPEIAAFRFSNRGGLLAYRTESGFEVLASVDGSEVVTLTGNALLFSPDDRFAVTLGELVQVLSLPVQAN